MQFKFSQLLLQCVRNTIRFKRGSLHNVESGPPCSRICRIRDALEYRFELLLHLTRHFPPFIPPRPATRSISQGRIHPIFPDVLTPLFLLSFYSLLPSFLYSFVSVPFPTNVPIWLSYSARVTTSVPTRGDTARWIYGADGSRLSPPRSFFFPLHFLFPSPPPFLYTFNRKVIRIGYIRIPRYIYSRVVSIDSKSFRGIRMIRTYIRWMVRVSFIVALLLDAKL